MSDLSEVEVYRLSLNRSEDDEEVMMTTTQQHSNSDDNGDDTNNNVIPVIATPPITKSSNVANVISDTNTTKTIYLIRHGESLGQLANEKRRRSDNNLRDCQLSDTGIIQAKDIINRINEEDNNVDYDTIELVVCSPLTRAIQTAILAFPNKPILIDYNLREVGTMIPENIPRSIKDVLYDLNINKNHQNIDYITLKPDNWPRNHDQTPNVIRKDQIRQSIQYLVTNRSESIIAVVCHYHVIRAALYKNPSSMYRTPKKKIIMMNMNQSLSSNNKNITKSKTKITPSSQQQSNDMLFSSPQPTLLSSNNKESDNTNATTTITATPSKTPSSRNQVVEIHPKNAIPIKCHLDILTYELYVLHD